MSFDPFEFTKEVKDLIHQGMIGDAERLIEETLNNGFLKNDNYRVVFARNIIKSSNNQRDRMNKFISSRNSDLYEIVTCNHAKIEISGGIPFRLTPNMKSGAYVMSAYTDPISVNYSFEGVLEKDLEKLTLAGFNKPANTVQRDSIFIERKCRVSALGGDDATIVNENGDIHESRSSRVAKISRSVLLKKPRINIKEAFVLPFPHSSSNYFHAMSEMIYGLRFAHMIGDHVPIVYDIDKFEILPAACDALSININRLIKREDIVDAVIDNAYLPDSPPFYWNSQIYSFFRSVHARISGVKSTSRKIYISRQKSKRSGDYELSLQRNLKEHGFDIIHAQDMSAIEQMEVFSNAECIVAPHGAGLTNMLYARTGVKIIEIFSENMISPDFFQRSKFITGDYNQIIVRDGEFDIWERIRQILE